MNNRIFVIDGDLNDSFSTQKLALALNSLGVLPRTFDISNVLDYVGDSYEQIAETLANLAQNPDTDLVILTGLNNLLNKAIPKVCYPIKLENHRHGNLTFTYYHSSLSNFLKYAKVELGTPPENDTVTSCSEIQVVKKEAPVRPGSKHMEIIYKAQKI